MPVAAPAARYLTIPGKRRLQQELDNLWLRRRPEVVAALKAAAAEGDRSENAEYIYRRKELREIDRRVRYLSRRLADAVVVVEPPQDHSCVFFGASVVVTDDEGVRRSWKIVGRDETDAQAGHISVESPVARALLGRKSGSEVTVRLPGGDQTLLIQSVEYRAEDYA